MKKMENFAAIDFETANNERTSVCSVGVVIVRDGMIVDSFLLPHQAGAELLLLLEHESAWPYPTRYGKCTRLS